MRRRHVVTRQVHDKVRKPFTVSTSASHVGESTVCLSGSEEYHLELLEQLLDKLAVFYLLPIHLKTQHNLVTSLLYYRQAPD